MKMKVKFTVSYETVIEIDDQEDLEDAISDIDIPEGENVKYVEDSFEVESQEEIQ